MTRSSLYVLLALISCGLINAELDWWQSMNLYQIYPRSWKDSDGDGIGDLPGIEAKLEHLVDAGYDAFWLSPINTSPMVDFGYDISNFTDIDEIFGTLDDFDSLVTKAKSLGLKVIMDFVPNHSSDQHDWFVRSLAGEEPYKDYYIWHNGTTSDLGIVSPPNNWVSVFGGSAWTWRSERQAYYLHQFTTEQPDLNYRNEYVVQEMKDVLTFWLDRGVDGFRMDAISHIFEVEDYPDEPLSGTTNDTTSSDYTLHHYTQDLDETYEMITQWRELLDAYTLASDNVTRIMMVETYANTTMTMKYYNAGAHFPFNFKLITDVDGTSTAAELKEAIEEWFENLPDNSTSNWVIGNHDRSRAATRYNTELIDALNIIDILLPGASIGYYGEEIGMENQWLSWVDTQDPWACNLDEDTYESVSRDPARTPFQWDATTSAGFSTNASTWLPVHDNYETLNLAAQVAANVSHYKVYQALTTLSKETVVQEGSLDVELLSDNVIAFVRTLSGQNSVIALINLGNSSETVSLGDIDDASNSLEVYTASIHSSLTNGSIVSKTSLNISAYAGIVLRSTTESTTQVDSEATTATQSEATTATQSEATTQVDSEATTQLESEATTQTDSDSDSDSDSGANVSTASIIGTLFIAILVCVCQL